MERMTVVG
jgi:hypothetical protein